MSRGGRLHDWNNGIISSGSPRVRVSSESDKRHAEARRKIEMVDEIRALGESLADPWDE